MQSADSGKAHYLSSHSTDFIYKPLETYIKKRRNIKSCIIWWPKFPLPVTTEVLAQSQRWDKQVFKLHQAELRHNVIFPGMI